MYMRPAQPVPAEALGARNARFAREAWAAGTRPDRRAALQLREAAVEFPTLARDTVRVRLGDAAAVCCVRCELVEPSPVRPRHGFFEVRARQLTHERTPRDAAAALAQLSALLTRLYSGTVVELEGLCVVPRVRVWSVRADVLVLGDVCGATDAAALALSVALQHARRPQLSIRGDDIVVHPPHEADPVPLTLHYLPVVCTFAVAADPYAPAAAAPAGALTLVADPAPDECAAAACLATVAVTPEGQVCGVEKLAGCDLPWALLRECVAAALALAPGLVQLAADAMTAHEQRRAAAFRAQFQWARTRLGVGKSELAAATAAPGDAGGTAAAAAAAAEAEGGAGPRKLPRTEGTASAATTTTTNTDDGGDSNK